MYTEKKSCKGDIEQMINSHFSIEGGRWCESKRIRMEGHKAKAKLRATEVKKCKLYIIFTINVQMIYRCVV